MPPLLGLHMLPVQGLRSPQVRGRARCHLWWYPSRLLSHLWTRTFTFASPGVSPGVSHTPGESRVPVGVFKWVALHVRSIFGVLR